LASRRETVHVEGIDFKYAIPFMNMNSAQSMKRYQGNLLVYMNLTRRPGRSKLSICQPRRDPLSAGIETVRVNVFDRDLNDDATIESKNP
jgi:hypothetical protein